ncbi:Trafficking protein particle complex subunit 6B [Dirofilaria immitis]
MNSLISGPCFPFEFLHAEIIRYEKKREAEKIDKRKSWIEQMRNNPQMDISLLDEQLKSVKQVFIQGNADTHLEALGYRVGFVLVEKIAKDLPRIITELERMKFLCKEFWTAAFGKQVDNLRTNHQVEMFSLGYRLFVIISEKLYTGCGILCTCATEKKKKIMHCFRHGISFSGVYVVQDNKFFILLNFAEGKQCVEESAIYLAFPCGVIRGALYNLGITSLVTSSVETLPAVKFHVHMQQKRRSLLSVTLQSFLNISTLSEGDSNRVVQLQGGSGGWILEDVVAAIFHIRSSSFIILKIESILKIRQKQQEMILLDMFDVRYMLVLIIFVVANTQAIFFGSGSNCCCCGGCGK